MFRAGVFAVQACGYRPRCALEIYDSGQVRIEKIFTMIGQCRFGIHDISRTELDPGNHLPRFNMPLELGIFLGAKRFGDSGQRRKDCLIFDRDAYRYQMFGSDIAGHDIAAHANEEARLVTAVRDWLASKSKQEITPGGQEIHRRLMLFRTDLPVICDHVKLNPETLTYGDYVNVVAAWLIEKY